VHHQRVLRHRIWGSLFIALFASGPAVASDVDLSVYSERIDDVARQLVADVRPTLAPHAQLILDDIEFEAPQSWSTNAEAHRAFGGRRIVEFNAGFLAVTDWLAQAMIADWAGHDGCLAEYSDYLAELVGHNSKRLWKGKQRRHVYDFTSYADNVRGRCEGGLTNTLDSARQQELRDEILDAVTATVLLHEIAHHVLEHVSGVGNNFMQRRLREVDADRWAITKSAAATRPGCGACAIC
jgi:hypothetical protein